jgi:hypothetical protein
MTPAIRRARPAVHGLFVTSSPYDHNRAGIAQHGRGHGAQLRALWRPVMTTCADSRQLALTGSGDVDQAAPRRPWVAEATDTTRPPRCTEEFKVVSLGVPAPAM